MKAIGSLAILFALSLAAATWVGSAGRDRPVIRVDLVAPEYSIADLWNAADMVAIVVPTGGQIERWNNASNTMWEAPEGSGILPMIFRDEDVAIATNLKGDAPGQLTIRNIGGTANGVEFVLGGLFDLKPGEQYLVFLEAVDFPTQEGFEQAICFVGQDQGLFQAVGGGFQNAAGRTVTIDDLKSL